MKIPRQTPLRIDLFGAAELMAEQLCGVQRKYALPHTILRLGSAYGAGGSNAISVFMEAGCRVVRSRCGAVVAGAISTPMSGIWRRGS